MVEPYATLVEQLGLGDVILRTGEIWSGVPGCSLTTTAQMIDRDPDLVRRMVAGFVRGACEVEDDPETSAKIALPYIGVAANVIQRALHHNRPDVSALDNDTAMARVVNLMVELGYLSETPSRQYKDLTFLREVCSIGQRESRLTSTHGGK
jgi:ABC-type nitrate/sulfonate/bicarbonate transport system substrate-binding protein